MFSVITLKHPNIHKTLYTIVLHTLTEKNIKDMFGDTVMFHGSFDNDNDASMCLEEVSLDDAKFYTKHIMQTFIPTIIFGDSRSILTYVGPEITPYPDFYRIPLNEYVILKNKFNDSFRFPNLDEFDDLVRVYSVIILKEHLFDSMENMFGYPTHTFVKEGEGVTIEKAIEYKQDKDNQKVLAFLKNLA